MKKRLLTSFLAFVIIALSLPVAAIGTGAADAAEASASTVTYEDIIASAANIVRQNEGSYSSVNPDDNGALSIGWLQWHANRALNLLKTIIAKDTATAKSLLGDTLYNEIVNASSWSTRILTSDESSRISALISTDEGKKAQDDLASRDLSSYIDRAIGLGVTDPAALVYYADIENQCGSGGGKKVLAAAAALCGSYADIDLDTLHEAALADSIAGRYSTRRQKTYNNCLLLEWELMDSSYEVWDIISARNVRKEPDTESTLVTTIAKGSTVIILEKAAFGSLTRGRTSMGWITLDDSSCVLNETLTGKYVPAPIIFDTYGGTFGASPQSKSVINGINTGRPSNSIIVYDSDYPYSAPQTNVYGAEAAVNADGIVISNPTYGTCKTEIPEGGFVLSGIGSGYTWLSGNVRIGNYVFFDKENMTAYVYESYSAFSATTKASATINGTNQSRPSNSLILYDSDYGYSCPMTNAYGTEVAVDSTGKVLNTPSYGLCQTEIPEGGFVLSGIGTGYTWLTKNVKAGEYIIFDKSDMTVYVYSNLNNYLANTKTSQNKSAFGTLPSPQKAGYTFNGWYTEDGVNVYDTTVCDSPYCVTLKAGWTKVIGHSLTYNTNGGHFADTAAAEITGINQSRPIDSLIIYTEGNTVTTNEYGTEVRVDANGVALNDPIYGLSNSEVPAGGFVLSGIGTMYTWMKANISKGMRIVFDEAAMTVTVCKTDAVYDAIFKNHIPGEPLGTLPLVQKEYHSFSGWYSPAGEKITESTIMPQGGLILYAKWEVLPGTITFNTDGGQMLGLISSADVAGTNIFRANNSLVIYSNKASTGTNKYGCEAIIGSDGIVDAVYPYGSGNVSIPEGCYALSGIGTMYHWIQNNLSVGNYVVTDGKNIHVWADLNAYDASKNTSVKYGEKYGDLPTAQKEGYAFLGWQDKNGNTVTAASTVSLYGDITLTAKWERLCNVVFDANGGKITSSAAATKASGINISRASNSLVIYAGKASTGTNVYGCEAVIGPDGTVISVSPYGKGNTTIPDGCTVLSGIGTMYHWIQNNLAVGKYVKISGYTVTAYESRAAYDAEDGHMYVRKGSALGAVPFATLSEKALSGWYSLDNAYTKDSVINGDTVLYARWTQNSATVLFNTAGGTIAPAKSSVNATGINTSRPGNSLIIYNNSYGYPAPFTNAYGAEAAVDANGYVISKPNYGTCKTTIPDGGFVLSGIGSMYSWLNSNVDVGDYIHIDESTLKISVYKSYGDYLAAEGKTIYCNKPYGILPTPVKEGYEFAGWQDASGTTVTETTVVTNCEIPVLTAIWKKAITLSFDTNGGTLKSATTTISGTNITRSANTLVLYKNKATTGTNVYGAEAVVDSTGKVVSIYSYGKGNNSIPSGGFVLSGHGTMYTWILTNIKAGCYVTVEGNTVKVFQNKASMTASSGTCHFIEGIAIGELPIPQKTGYTFEGWYTPAGVLVSADSILSEVSSPLVLTAKWK